MTQEPYFYKSISQEEQKVNSVIGLLNQRLDSLNQDIDYKESERKGLLEDI